MLRELREWDAWMKSNHKLRGRPKNIQRRSFRPGAVGRKQSD